MYLPEELHRFLAAEAASREISMAEVAREAISEYRARAQAERPKGVRKLIGIIGEDAPASDVANELDAPLNDAEWAAWAEKKGLRDSS